MGGKPLVVRGVNPRLSRSQGEIVVYPPNGLPSTFRCKGVNPAIDLIMNLTIFWRAWKFDFWHLLGVYPPGLALADYWNHLLGVYPPWPGVYPPSLAGRQERINRTACRHQGGAREAGKSHLDRLGSTRETCSTGLPIESRLWKAAGFCLTFNTISMANGPVRGKSWGGRHGRLPSTD